MTIGQASVGHGCNPLAPQLGSIGIAVVGLAKATALPRQCFGSSPRPHRLCAGALGFLAGFSWLWSGPFAQAKVLEGQAFDFKSKSSQPTLFLDWLPCCPHHDSMAWQGGAVLKPRICSCLCSSRLQSWTGPWLGLHES